MRIISKFQDYYDCGLAMGVDTNIVYERHTQKDVESVSKFPMNSREYNIRETIPHCYAVGEYDFNCRNDTIYGNTGFLHFCGKRYFFKIHNKEVKDSRDIIQTYVWNQKDFQKYFRFRSVQHCWPRPCFREA